MKRLLFAVALTAALFSGCKSKDPEVEENNEPTGQLSLFDKEKEAVAYIDYDDEATIYMFGGIPVAYLTPEGEEVYGFNGKVLGWFVDGVLYSRADGCVAGAKHGTVKGEVNLAVTKLESIKGVKYIKPVKHICEVPPARPLLKDKWSETSLTDLLQPEEE